MRAAVIEGDGADKRLIVRDIPAPTPGPDELLVRVHSSSLNQADLRMAASHFRASENPAAESYAIGGLEFAGEVIGWGDQVSGFAVGDRVMAMGGGGWAEFAVIDNRLAIPVPRSYEWSEAAASAISFVTAHDALVRAAGFTSGESLLVNGATSAAGLAAVQIGALLDAALIVGTTRQRSSLDILRAAGCSLPVNTTESDLVESVHGELPEGVAVAIDVVGGDTLDTMVACMQLQGRIVSLGRVGGARSTVDLDEFARRRITLRGTTFRTRSKEERFEVIQRFVREVGPFMESGVLRPVLTDAITLDDVPDLRRLLSERSGVGKITVRIS